MRLTDEMVERDDARYAGRNGLAEIKYLGREVEHRKAITNDDIRFMAWAFRFADAIIKGQRNKIENLMETIERQAEIERLQPKKGHWEMKEDPFGLFDEIPVCSECGCTNAMRKKTEFCEHCGADMRGGDGNDKAHINEH